MAQPHDMPDLARIVGIYKKNDDDMKAPLARAAGAFVTRDAANEEPFCASDVPEGEGSFKVLKKSEVEDG